MRRYRAILYPKVPSRGRLRPKLSARMSVRVFSSCLASSTQCLRGAKVSAHRAGHHRSSRTRQQLHVSARRDYNVDIKDRILSALPYLIPLFDGLKYGKFLFLQYPGFARLLAPLDPLVRLYYTIPFAGLICFFAVYAGIVNNRELPRFVRYNAMQSILLDIILILPSLVENLFRPALSGPGLQLYITCYNTIWIFVFASVVYAVASCLAGVAPRIPLVADSADQQVM